MRSERTFVIATSRDRSCATLSCCITRQHLKMLAAITFGTLNQTKKGWDPARNPKPLFC